MEKNNIFAGTMNRIFNNTWQWLNYTFNTRDD